MLFITSDLLTVALIESLPSTERAHACVMMYGGNAGDPRGRDYG